MTPHPTNFCGGAFSDWCDVVLTTECNGHCKWCVERDGYKPTDVLSVEKLFDIILATGKKNISIVGGEPTLLPERLIQLSGLLTSSGKDVYVTSNGIFMRPLIFLSKYVKQINISRHHHHAKINSDIIGVPCLGDVEFGAAMSKMQCAVRANCNLQKGGIAYLYQAGEFASWAADMGFDGIKFSELSFADDYFVSAESVFGDIIDELKLEPLQNGCNHKLPRTLGHPLIEIKRVCGRHTMHHPQCANYAVFEAKKCIVYPDGMIFDHWPYFPKDNAAKAAAKGADMKLVEFLAMVKEGRILPEDAARTLERSGIRMPEDPVHVVPHPGTPTGYGILIDKNARCIIPPGMPITDGPRGCRRGCGSSGGCGGGSRRGCGGGC